MASVKPGTVLPQNSLVPGRVSLGEVLRKMVGTMLMVVAGTAFVHSFTADPGLEAAVLEPLEQRTSPNRPVAPWSSPPGAGLDLNVLNQCLEKHVRDYVRQEAGLDERFPETPLMSKHWNNFDKLYIGGAFGSLTTWAASQSKHLAYLILPKVGSMTFRAELASCDPKRGIPCDVLNNARRPFQPYDSGMHFGLKGGFFHSFVVPRSRGKDLRLKTSLAFSSIQDTVVPFTFVTDPVTKFIGAYVQVHKYSSDVSPAEDERYRKRFVSFLKQFTKFDRPRRGPGNAHMAPQMYYLYNAAMEATAMAQAKDPGVEFSAPFAFVGRLDRAHAQRDWEGLVDELVRRFPEAGKLVNRTLYHANGSKHLTHEQLLEAQQIADKEHLPTMMMMLRWEEQHLRAKKALGPLASPKTMPVDLVRRLCAAFYVEYQCFGLDFPEPCVDEQGVYNVTEFRPHVRQPL